MIDDAKSHASHYDIIDQSSKEGENRLRPGEGEQEFIALGRLKLDRYVQSYQDSSIASN